MHWSKLTRALSLCVLLAGFACGDDNDKGNGNSSQSSLSVGLAPATVTLTQGASTSVAIALTRVALDGTSVTFTVSDPPAGVTASLEPDSTTADTALLTLSAGEAAPVGAAALIVTATADGGVTASATLDLMVSEPTPITVTGRYTNAVGVPFPAVPIIHVWGRNATTPVDTTAAADGSFTAANIRPPYDVVVVVPTVGTRVFIGLTGATVALGDLLDSIFAPATVSVAGSLAPANADNTTVVIANTANGGAAVTVNPGGDGYALSISPPVTGTSLNATFSALQLTRTSGQPSAYLAYGQQATVLSTAVANTVNLSMSGPVASHNLSVRARDSGGAPVSALSVAWVTDHKSAALANAAPSTDTTVLLVPADPRIRLSAQMTATSGKNGTVLIKSVGTTTTSLDVQLRPGLTEVTPADAAINVTDAQSFSANDEPGATYYFAAVNEAASFNLHVISAAREVSLARLRALGAGLPSSTTFDFQAIAVYGGAPEPFAAHRVNVTELALTDGGGYRAAVDHTFATQ